MIESWAICFSASGDNSHDKLPDRWEIQPWGEPDWRVIFDFISFSFSFSSLQKKAARMQHLGDIDSWSSVDEKGS